MTRGPLPTVRRMEFAFDADIPRWWWAGSALLTHVTNGLNLVFPAGERFFVRSVRQYLDRVEDPALRERVRAFAGQEVQHGRQHERAFQVLEAQGYEVRSFLDWYEQFAYEEIEQRCPPVLRLSATVALEHLTASLAEFALATPFLDEAHPVMRDLLRWHAAEEIEHRDVAFEVLQIVDPRYRVRIAGLVVAVGTLLCFWSAGTRHLLRQEPGWSRRRYLQERRAIRAKGLNRAHLWRGIARYLDPRFHPGRAPLDALAADYLAGMHR